VLYLLQGNSSGLSIKEIARRCEVSVRTTYRDLEALGSELRVPVWEEGSLRGIGAGYFLPPLHLTLTEAMALFVSARLACSYSDEHDRNLEQVFLKLAAVLPVPISEHVQRTALSMADKPENASFCRVFEILTRAWADRKRVRIWYPRFGPDGLVLTVTERLVDPYFMEPSRSGHACYVIGLDHDSSEVRTFKIERISDIELTNEVYDIPAGWSVDQYLRGSWGIVTGEEVEVKIRFSRAVAGRVRESFWHPSEVVQTEPGGTLLYQVRVAGTVEITPWILSWGAEAEVLEPAELRTRFAETATRLTEQYRPTEGS
jgi:predicted DNA-binding transcriptional regulator YafY